MCSVRIRKPATSLIESMRRRLRTNPWLGGYVTKLTEEESLTEAAKFDVAGQPDVLL